MFSHLCTLPSLIKKDQNIVRNNFTQSYWRNNYYVQCPLPTNLKKQHEAITVTSIQCALIHVF